MAFRYAGNVEVKVLPSPVRISAILPLCKAIPPAICTSKWRIFMTRLEPSRTTAKASGSKASSDSPAAKRSRKLWVLARNSSSFRASSPDSSALIRSTVLRYCLRRRSLRLPKILVRKGMAMSARSTFSPGGRETDRLSCQVKEFNTNWANGVTRPWSTAGQFLRQLNDWILAAGLPIFGAKPQLIKATG